MDYPYCRVGRDLGQLVPTVLFESQHPSLPSPPYQPRTTSSEYFYASRPFHNPQREWSNHLHLCTSEGPQKCAEDGRTAYSACCNHRYLPNLSPVHKSTRTTPGFGFDSLALIAITASNVYAVSWEELSPSIQKRCEFREPKNTHRLHHHNQVVRCKHRTETESIYFRGRTAPGRVTR